MTEDTTKSALPTIDETKTYNNTIDSTESIAVNLPAKTKKVKSSLTDYSPASNTRSKRVRSKTDTEPNVTDPSEIRNKDIIDIEDTQCTQETTSTQPPQPITLSNARKNIQFWSTNSILNYVQYKQYVEDCRHDERALNKSAITVQLQQYTKMDDVVLQIKNRSLSKIDFITLASSSGKMAWLTDQIINFYGTHCIMERNAYINKKKPEATHVKNWFIASSFHIHTLLGDNNCDSSKQGIYDASQEAANLWKKINFNEYRGLLIPYNHKGWHWTLVKVDFENQQITYLDSMQANRQKYHDFVQVRLQAVRTYITSRMVKLPKLSRQIPEEAWVLISQPDDVSQQDNTFDCGVFTLMFADFITLGYPIDRLCAFSKSYRKMILIQLWNLFQREE
jgi:Ulp1 family protease